MDRKDKTTVCICTTAEVKKEWKLYALDQDTTVNALIHQAMTALMKNGAGDDVKAELKKEKERNQQLTSEIERLETLVSILKKEKVRVNPTDWVQWGPWKARELPGIPRMTFVKIAKECELESGMDFFQLRIRGKGYYTFVNRKCLLRILNKFGGVK